MKKLSLLVGLVLFLLFVAGQDNKRLIFWGVNPSVTVEPYYDTGEVDINVFPPGLSENAYKEGRSPANQSAELWY